MKINKDPKRKTLRQWIFKGRVLNADAMGERMYTNGFRQYIATYYSIEETHEATKEELKAAKEPYLAPIREKDRARKRKDRARKKKKELIRLALELPLVPCQNPSGVVTFDLETTGLNVFDDEPLQIFICDGDGNTLLDTYIHPYVKESWYDAEQIHGITPNMVKTAPYLHELLPVLQGIFRSANLLVTYNGIFDEMILREAGIDLQSVPEFDVMHKFAPIYGDWDEYHHSYRWKSLAVCADYFGYEFSAHNAKEDALATLYCYKKILEIDPQ